MFNNTILIINIMINLLLFIIIIYLLLFCYKKFFMNVKLRTLYKYVFLSIFFFLLIETYLTQIILGMR